MCACSVLEINFLLQASWHGSAGQDWLEIDLLIEYAVVKVVFYNRKDCCHSRANNALLTLMDASRNVVNTAVLNSDVMQTFTFTEVDTCSVAPYDLRSPQIPQSAVFLSDSVVAVLSRPAHAEAVACRTQIDFVHVQSQSALWTGCVNFSLMQGAELLFDREQRLFSLLQGDSIIHFDSKGSVTYSWSPGIGSFAASNRADTVETDLAVIVTRGGFYSHCNVFTGSCVDLVSESACGAPVLAAAYGLHAFLKCNQTGDIISSVIAGCEANAKPAVRLSGCVSRRSHFVSTMTLQDTSTGEAEWLWAVSFRLQALFRALPEPGAATAAASLHATACAQVFEVLAYVHSAHRSGWLLLPSTRRQLGFLGIQHSIFDTLPCIGASGAVNATAVRETVEQLQRLHPWPHVPVAA